MTDHERTLERIEACRELYLKYRGKKHEQIEREMRELGYMDFHRRVMYRRYENGRAASGWIERYGWDVLVKESLATDSMYSIGSAASHCGEAVPHRQGSTEQSEPAKRATDLRQSLTDPVVRGDGEASLTAMQQGRAVRIDPAREEYDEFKQWLISVSPNMTWTAKHQLYIYKRLRRMTEGDLKRLMIFMPPRHGKSELVTVRYAAWRMKKDPGMRTIIASYGQKLANSFSRSIKRVLAEDHALTAGNAAALGCNAGSSGVTDAEHAPMFTCGSAPSHCGEACRTESGTKLSSEAAEQATESRHSLEDSVSGESGEASLTAVHSGEAARSNTHTFQLANQKQNGCEYTDPQSAVRDPQSPKSPFPFASQRPKNTESEWETTMGGGLKAVGVGAGITGFGANLIIIDDPVKNREQANSLTYREKVWNWWNNDLYTRLEPNGQVVLIQTRWHEDDLAGRLLRQADEGGEQWGVVDLPALAEEGEKVRKGESKKMSNEESRMDEGGLAALQCGEAVPHRERPQNSSEPAERATDVRHSHEDTYLEPSGEASLAAVHCGKAALGDPLGRNIGDALWPERFSVPELKKTREQIGTWSFASLYQQRPSPAEGGIFKRDWFKQVINAPPPGLKWVRAYDLACSAGTTSDYTASFRVAVDKEQNIYIDGGFRRKIEYPEQRRYILGRIAAEPDASHIVELSANGHAVLADLRREKQTLGRALRGVKPRGDKHSRAIGWMAAAEAGRVFLVRGHWNHDLVEEAAAFPTGTHDDQIDAISLAVQGLSERKEFAGSF